MNFPKGNNNSGADVNDSGVTFTDCNDGTTGSNGYWSAQNWAHKNGSGSTFNKTTHNGQACGVADINGDQWQITQGLTTLGVAAKTITAITAANPAVFTKIAHGYTDGQQIMLTGTGTPAAWNALSGKFYTVANKDDNTFELTGVSTVGFDAVGAYDTNTLSATAGAFYMLKESIALKDVTGGNTVDATDHFDETFIAANMDVITPVLAGAFSMRFGSSTSQVLSGEVSRSANAYKLTAAGLPMAATSFSAGGSNTFGTDYYYQSLVAGLCPIRGGAWNDTTYAGVWGLTLSDALYGSHNYVSSRSCLYV
jgi:hypothetical protein